MASQEDNGKAFEYAVARVYFTALRRKGLAVDLVRDKAFLKVRSSFEKFSPRERKGFRLAAVRTVQTLFVLEPNLWNQKSAADILTIRITDDREGQSGDVRDVVFERLTWQGGISAKNNHDAVKHSRLSNHPQHRDFGERWVQLPCSTTYFHDIYQTFRWIHGLRKSDPTIKWKDIESVKGKLVLRPILEAFRDEILRMEKRDPTLAAKLLNYLIGIYPFYKFKKDDKNNCVVVKAFNVGGKLNEPAGTVRATHTVDRFHLPTRIIELTFKSNSDDTLIMTMDEGWQLLFRLHSATTPLDGSLKFNIELLGNPPVLFTQHLFS